MEYLIERKRKTIFSFKKSQEDRKNSIWSIGVILFDSPPSNQSSTNHNRHERIKFYGKCINLWFYKHRNIGYSRWKMCDEPNMSSAFIDVQDTWTFRTRYRHSEMEKIEMSIFRTINHCIARKKVILCSEWFIIRTSLVISWFSVKSFGLCFMSKRCVNQIRAKHLNFIGLSFKCFDSHFSCLVCISLVTYLDLHIWQIWIGRTWKWARKFFFHKFELQRNRPLTHLFPLSALGAVVLVQST